MRARTLGMVAAGGLVAGSAIAASVYRATHGSEAPDKAPAPGPIPGRFIVGFEPTVTAAQRDAFLRELGATSARHVDSINASIVDAPTSMEHVNELAKRTGIVAWAQPDIAHEGRAGDPRRSAQYALEQMRVPEAWKTATGKGVIVAITDTPIDARHPDLAANMWRNPREKPGNGKDDDRNGYVDDVNGWNFITRGPDTGVGPFPEHGTHVAGIVGAVANNGIGIAGIAPDAQIMALPINGDDASLSTSNAILAFEYAADHGAKIVNASWGDPAYEPALAAAVKSLADRDVLLVVAAGNNGFDTGAIPSYPDNYPGALSVTSSDKRGKPALDVNHGTATVDVAAPGDGILSLKPGGGWVDSSGTSMASPQVAGVAALVKSRFPHLTMAEVRGRIEQSAQRTGWGNVVGHGLVDAAAAVQPIGSPRQLSVGGVTGGPIRSARATTIDWQSDIERGQGFEVQVASGFDRQRVVRETFERGRIARPEHLERSGAPGSKRFVPTAGAGTNKTWGLRTPSLRSQQFARLDLRETVRQPATLTFDLRARGNGRGEGKVSIFVDGDLYERPRTPSDNWHSYKVHLAPGEHDIAIIASHAEEASFNRLGYEVDNVRIDHVVEPTWQTVESVRARTSARWTPPAAGEYAVRVRADNGDWSTDWVTSDPFTVER
jgi:subtilisin family serine protease